MKRFFQIIAILALCGAAASAQENKGEERRQSQLQTVETPRVKLLDAMFGVLPNNEGKINQYLFLKVNYTPFISTSITYYDQKYATVDREEDDDDNEEIEEIESLERTDVNFTFIKTRHNVVTIGPSFSMDVSPSLYMDYYHETKSWELNESWENDSGMMDLSFAKYRVNSRSFMPIIKADLIFTVTSHLDLSLGAGYLVRSFDKNEYNEFCTTTDPDPAEQIDSYYDAEIDVDYHSSGYVLNASLKLKELPIGSLQFDAYYLAKIGRSRNVEKYWDEDDLEYVFDRYRADDKRTLLRLDAFWQLDFLTISGIVPIIKFGYMKQKVVLDDEYTDENLTYDQWDLGIVLKI